MHKLKSDVSLSRQYYYWYQEVYDKIQIDVETRVHYNITCIVLREMHKRIVVHENENNRV